jgi:D-alanyl-D-alanine carboxypeptidase
MNTASAAWVDSCPSFGRVTGAAIGLFGPCRARHSASKVRGVLRAAAAFAIGLALVACSQASRPSPMVSPSRTALPSATAAFSLGDFPPLPTEDLRADVAATLQAILEEELGAVDAPGIAAAVISADLGTWVGAAGTADGHARLDPTAQFGIGSVTKTVIAAQVLQLVESGAVDLDRPIGEYLGDEVPTNGATVRQVLGMRSGIEELTGDPGVICADLAATVAIDDLRDALSDGALFEPGTRFRYTSANYLLAGLLIEKVTGTTVARALRSGVLTVAGLERLVYQDEERPTAPLAAPFVIHHGPEMPEPSELLELGDGYLPARCLAAAAGSAGGMASDATTLARWGYLLYGGWVLGDEALAEMTHFEDGYGLAAHDHESSFGVPAVGHEGTVPGYVAQLLAFPEEGLSVAVLVNTNGDEREMTRIAGRIRATLAPLRGGGS